MVDPSEYAFMEEREELMVSLVDEQIHLHNDLIIALAERWCMETNTFIFPWGESTVTLEDTLLLGGFSVLGRSVLKPVKTKESDEMERSLRELYKVVRARKLCVYNHAGMEFAFPPKGLQNVHQAVIPIAIHLSQGNSMPLAPAVLAIYRNLNLLNQLIASSANIVVILDAYKMSRNLSWLFESDVSKQ
ncbi:hypothetical protein P3S67_016313 [Capsicum chacoense]